MACCGCRDPSDGSYTPSPTPTATRTSAAWVQHWHLLPLDLDLDAIPLADAEVSGLVDLDLDDALALADGDIDTIPARYATRTDTGLEYTEATLTRAALVPNYLTLDQLYLRLFVTARRFCAGERTHVLW